MHALYFPFIRLTLFLIVGILIGHSIQISTQHVFLCIFILLFILVFAVWITKNKFGKFKWIDVLIGFIVIAIGNVNFQVHDPRNRKDHYTNFIDHSKTAQVIHFNLRETLKPSSYSNNYVINVLQVGNQRVFGKALLNIKQDSIVFELEADHLYTTYTSFFRVNAPINPHQFDYRSYLENKQIYHQLNIDQSQILLMPSSERSPFGLAHSIRKTINQKLVKHRFNGDALAIVNALLLGQRQDISKEIYDSYAQAGAIHILAISGLHVGIILLLLNHILRPLAYLKNGSYIKTVVLIFLLWCFALVAGLSASVTRAVTMFSVFAIAMHIKRPTNTINSLAISAFILLLVQPEFLFDVGFQLSYFAVLAIITIHPLMSKLWRPSNRVLKFYWNIIVVTISAQIGVLPLSLYYFHQFPGLFFISNLVIIPVLGIILALGILVIALALLDMLPLFLSKCYYDIISTLNHFVGWVAERESFIFQNISFNILDVILCYLLIILGIFIIYQKSFHGIVGFFMVLISFQLYHIWNIQQVQHQFIVFHKSRHSVLGFREGLTLNVHHSLKLDSIANESLIINYTIGENIKTIKTDTLRSAYTINDHVLLIVDRLGVYSAKTLKPDMILLRNSPRINLSRLINQLQPRLIISDGSNYRSFQERWMNTCKSKKIPFYQTGKKGAFILNY